MGEAMNEEIFKKISFELRKFEEKFRTVKFDFPPNPSQEKMLRSCEIQSKSPSNCGTQWETVWIQKFQEEKLQWTQELEEKFRIKITQEKPWNSTFHVEEELSLTP